MRCWFLDDAMLESVTNAYQKVVASAPAPSGEECDAAFVCNGAEVQSRRRQPKVKKEDTTMNTLTSVRRSGLQARDSDHHIVRA
jgi:hypothetical protein